jgi:pilus assembly protein CpaE
MSVARRTIVLMSDQPATASAVNAALQSSPAGSAAPSGEDVCQDVRDLAVRLEKTGGAHAALVDIDGRPNQILSALEPVVRRFPETRFIVLANSMESELMLEAMQMGARHFMAKQSIPTTLVGVIDRLCANGNTARASGLVRESQGNVVSVLSASGGCGATTIAVNLAAEIELAGSESNLLIDLDYNYGAVGAYLGLDAPHGAADLMARANTVDPELIHTTALNHSEKMKVLISAASVTLGDAAGAGYGRLGEIVRSCKQSYRTTVIDAPRVTHSAAAMLACESTVTLLVLQLAVKDIRMARAMLAAITAHGANPASVLVLINRYHKRSSMIKLEEAEKALSGFQIRCLANDFQSVSRAMNFGQPLHKAAPRSAVRKELEQIAGEILNGSLISTLAGAAR